MNEPLNLVIDCQLLQTGAWDRGMGKYSVNLLKALATQSPDSRLTLIINKNIPTSKARKEAIASLIEGSVLTELDLSYHAEVKQGREFNKTNLNKFIHRQFAKQDVLFLILSNFTFDYVATFPDKVKKAIILYDLIPLRNWDNFKDLFAPETYFEHYRDFIEADIIYSISTSTKEDSVELLGIEESKIFDIGGASIPRSDLTQDISEDISALSHNRFILFPSADFSHKNNEQFSQAFNKFNKIFGEQFKLVITSNFSKQSEYEIKSISDNIEFTGNINDAEYQKLLESCEAVAFVSTSEGLGLPLLEAISAEKPVVASNIKTHLEISSKAFNFCDPTNVDDIVRALISAISRNDWANQKVEYSRILQERTWDASAKTLLSSIEPRQVRVKVSKVTERLNIYFDAPESSLECVDIQKTLLNLKKEGQEMNLVLTSDPGNKPIYINYLGQPSKAETKVKSQKDIHIISNKDNLHAITRAALGDGTIILNVSTADIIASLIKNKYIGTSELSQEKVLAKLFNHRDIYSSKAPSKKAKFIKPIESIKL
jgi:glycosyltransferase involved in cell wall biosynthesis